jgi:prepilin-type N-terminal cleavage/methylation domain-containing protein
MRRYVTGQQRQLGFSLLEILIVVAIGLIITAIGLPRMTNVIANMKLRSSMTTVSGLLQNTRMLAIKKNKMQMACHFNRAAIPYSLVYYTKDAANTCAALANGDNQVEMEAPITPYDTPTGALAPAAIDNGTLGLTLDPLTTDPAFNSRGLPCNYSSGTCSNSAFIKYFKDNRIGGSGGWAAISITPAGRIKRWFWNGSTWVD